MSRPSHNSGFTLLEILLVVAIISILAGIVIVAINPAKQLGNSRDAQRKSDINSIYKAANQYLIDNGVFPQAVRDLTADTPTVICLNDLPEGCVNLSDALVPTYIPAIPKDPQTTSGTGYKLAKVGSNIYVEAPDTEIGYTSQAGQTTSTPTIAFVGVIPSGHPPATTTGSGGGSSGGGGGGGSSDPLAEGLVGYWSGNGNTTDSVSANNGSWNGNALYDTGNNQSQAFNLDGGSYITLPAIPTGSSAMSAAAWVNTSAGGYQGIVGSGNDANGPHWEIMKDPGSASPYVDFGTGCEQVAWGYPIVGTGWHYVAFTYDGATLSIYVDGTLANSGGCSTTIDDSLTLAIGQSPTYIEYGYYFNGKIEGVAIWNRALTAGEVSDLYNGGSGHSL